MENCTRKTRRLLWGLRLCLISCLCVLAFAVWGVVRLLPEKEVVPFCHWEKWPYPFAFTGKLPEPAVTNLYRMGSKEEKFFDRLQKCMLLADEVATQMVYEFHSQAEAGKEYDILTPAIASQRRLASLRKEVESIYCPRGCKEVVSATARTLMEAEKFYRVSSACGRGFSLRALARAQKAYMHQVEVCSGFYAEPVVPETLIENILTNDCEALSRIARDWARTAESEKWFARCSTVIPENPDDRTPQQEFQEAHHSDPYLNGLWIVLSGKGYSPYLASSFLRWRSSMQPMFYGMSNWSEIPNRHYNKVRFMALDRVSAFLRKHPNDLHAQAQKEVLLNTPNIQRGGLFGNSCMFPGRRRAAEQSATQ